MKRIDALLRNGRGDFWYFGKSALDRYEKKHPPVVSVATTAGLGELAGSFEGLSFPGLESADALMDFEGVSLLFSTVDSLEAIPTFSLSPFNMVYSVREGAFHDRSGEYDQLRKGEIEGNPVTANDWNHLLRHLAWGNVSGDGTFPFPVEGYSLPPSFLRERDRFFLEDILAGDGATPVLDLLFSLGWIEYHFPALAELSRIEQNKEFHPEGNVWEHTLETLKYRKDKPLNLSLALLFHDLGKARAVEVGQNRFHGHAQIGAELLEPVLRKWDFSDGLIEEVLYLVGNHMMPAAIERLPYHKKREVIEDELFPQLLELYRCDLSSSFNGLDGYYDACRHYKSFRKNRNNPYRQADGSLKRGAC